MSVEIVHGDCRDVLATLEPDSFSAAVTDPPYHLTQPGGNSAINPANRGQTSSPHSSRSGFMGFKWDGGDVAFRPETWAAVYRVLKPGAHLLAFGGTRTYHRLACAIEDAGFEIRDSIMWLYGSGFPKSLDVSKAIDRAAGAEREAVGTKLGRPGMAKDGGNQRNGFDHAFGGEMSGLMSTDITAPATEAARQWQGWGTSLKPACEMVCVARKPSAAVASAELHNLTHWDHWCSSKSDGEDKILTGRALHPGARSYRARIDKNGVEVAREDLGAYEPFAIDAVAANVLRHGTGAINIDASRVATNAPRPLLGPARGHGNGSTYSGGLDGSLHGSKHLGETTQARWPANVCHDGSPEVLAAFAKFGDRASAGSQANDQLSGGYHGGIHNGDSYPGDTGTAARFFKECQPEPEEQKGRWPANVVHDGSPEVLAAFAKFGDAGSSLRSGYENSRDAAVYGVYASSPTNPGNTYGDSGTAARFYFCAKADASEHVGSHPTVKPVELMSWLVRMVTPSGGKVLDPFAGTGSTLVACDRLGFDALGIEQDAQTVADAHEKLRRMRARRAIGRVDERPAILPGQLEFSL